MLGLVNQISALFFILVLFVVYFSKERIKTEQMRAYNFLLISTLMMLIIDIIATTLALSSNNDFLIQLFSKLYLFNLTTFSVLFVNYSVKISYKFKENIMKKFNSLIWIISAINFVMFMCLPLENYKSGSTVYTYGMGPEVAQLITVFLTLAVVILIFININKENKKMYAPLLMFVVLGMLLGFLQLFFPELLIISYIYSFFTFIMYFLIENPDLKVIKELNAAKDLAERANSAKSDFLSSMSHEIRTPLNAIVNLSSEIEHNKDLPDEMREDAGDIVSASSTLLEIVGNIMDISKIESNKLEIITVPYNIREELESVVRLNQTRIVGKDIKMTLRIADDIPFSLYGDKPHIKQVLNNLLSNACKYTEKGEINVSLKCVNKNDMSVLMFTVQDTGKGIKETQISKLFDKFERLDAEKNSTIEGTGLGLAITKKLVELMSGTINVTSQYGSGSIFIVQIPQKINKEYTKVITESVMDTDISYIGKKILVVDDNKVNLKIARRVLEKFNITVDESLSGFEAINLIKENDYDLIFMDIMMPEMGGIETLKKIKLERIYDRPVIAVTADAVAGAREKYLSEGFSEYISKPFNKEQISELLKDMKL